MSEKEDIENIVAKGLVQKMAAPALVGLVTVLLVYQNWGTISTASRKLHAVDENTQRLDDLSARVKDMELKIITLEDFQGDMTTRVEVNEAQTRVNTAAQVSQRERALPRIAKQKVRDSFIEEGREWMQEHDIKHERSLLEQLEELKKKLED